MTYYVTGNTSITAGSVTIPSGAPGMSGAVYALGAGGAGGAGMSGVSLGYNGSGYYTNITYPSPSVNITQNDITVNGTSLKDFMNTVQDRLAIMRPNPELEKEFDELRECAERYRELEKKFSEQKKVWDVLRSDDK